MTKAKYEAPTPEELRKILWALGSNGKSMTQAEAARLLNLNSSRAIRRYLKDVPMPFTSLYALVSRGAGRHLVDTGNWRYQMDDVLNPRKP